jgi:hypothetical protein
MTTSAIRGLILAAAVVLGAILIGQAFSGNPSQAVAPPASPTPSPSVSPSISPSAPASPSRDLVKNVRIQVLNGTQTTGLAAEQAQRLRHAGYKVIAVEQAPVTYTHTTIYYRSGAKANAEAMKQRYYPTALVKPKPSSIHANVALTVILGADLGTSPSPSASST